MRKPPPIKQAWKERALRAERALEDLRGKLPRLLCPDPMLVNKPGGRCPVVTKRADRCGMYGTFKLATWDGFLHVCKGHRRIFQEQGRLVLYYGRIVSRDRPILTERL